MQGVRSSSLLGSISRSLALQGIIFFVFPPSLDFVTPRRRQGDVHEGLGRLTAVFVKLASVALSQGWIDRAKVAHQAVLIVRRKASVTTPLHACVQGAIERLSRSDRHVTLRFGSTDIGIVFPFRDQKNTNLVRDSTQSMRLSCFGPA